jgi:prolipoprotein diacylglyceryl transferase
VTTTLLASFPSPSQGVWHLGPIPLRAYALFILVGVIAALFIGNKRWSERGGEPGVIFDIALWAIIFGLIGGRLYHVLTDWTTYFGPGGAGLVAAFKIQEGGLGIWGAVALGGVGAWIGCRRKGIPLPAFGDAVAPGIVLAQAIGRIGNYFNQELYGRPTSLPWGLEIFERRDANGALDSLNGASTGQLIEIVHPTFLYELLWNLLVFAFLIWVDRRFRIGHGRLFALYVAAYCFGRFWVELMRSDMATHIAGIRINSFVSVFVFIGAVVYIMVAPKGREDPSELQGDVAVDDKAEKKTGEKDSRADEVTKELVAVAATTGVVAAAKAAGAKEDEDAGDDAQPQAEAVTEGEQLAEDVANAPAEDIAEAEAFAEAGEEADAAEEVGGLGSVEGEDAVDADAAAAEVHEAAVENAEGSADLADEVSDDASAEDSVESAVDEPKAGEEAEAEEVGGLGSVEGEDAVDADVAAAEVHEAAVENAEESADLADEVASEKPEESEPEPEDAEVDAAEEVGGLGSVEGEDAVDADAAAAEVHEAAVENAEGSADLADEVSDDASAEDSVQSAVDKPDADEETQAEEVGDLGSVEGDDAVDADAAAEQVHEVAVENAEGSAELADEVASEKPEESEPEPEDAEVDAAEEVGDLGSVEGDDAVDADAAAAQVHEAAVENAEGSAELADEVASEKPEESEPEPRGRRSRRIRGSRWPWLGRGR